MSDLISRSALLEEFAGSGFLLESIVRHCIEKAPAVDAEPVRRGEWIPKTYSISVCSVCEQSHFAHVESWNYCPNCGAKMTEKKARDLKPCDSCEHYEWDMPQCKGCNPENGFNWYTKRR